ncbi:hypothetical protein [Pseudovibrio sp. Tun.PSC04-5.I4]|nr:hypothetical protein [Pseudovibrio sp. Tun.PSC04-5.I4]
MCGKLERVVFLRIYKTSSSVLVWAKSCRVIEGNQTERALGFIKDLKL